MHTHEIIAGIFIQFIVIQRKILRIWILDFQCEQAGAEMESEHLLFLITD